jgi:hypothetical protein
MKNNLIIAVVIALIVGLGGGFLGGMMYQKNQTSPLGQNGITRQGGNFAGRLGQNSNFRPVRGQVLNMTSDSLTVKMNDGSTKIIVLSASTAFMQSTKATLNDIKNGDTVNVIGSQNTDGSVTAQDIQINPPMGGFGRGANGQPTVKSSPVAGQ